MGWADYYSDSAADYSRFRPTYPAELFEYLASLTPAHIRAWDCATGNGQAAQQLSQHFDAVIGTDASPGQLRHAFRRANVTFAACRADAVPIRRTCVDLTTVAQALHWFADDGFFAEVARVSKPGAVIAAWTYSLLEIAPAIDRVIRHFYTDVVGAYWPPERRHVMSGYRSLPFPYRETPAPEFRMTASWSLEGLLGYVTTWSAVKRARAARGDDPVAALATRLRGMWGPAGRARQHTWPLQLRVGIVEPQCEGNG